MADENWELAMRRTTYLVAFFWIFFLPSISVRAQEAMLDSRYVTYFLKSDEGFGFGGGAMGVPKIPTNTTLLEVQTALVAALDSLNQLFPESSILEHGLFPPPAKRLETEPSRLDKRLLREYNSTVDSRLALSEKLPWGLSFSLRYEFLGDALALYARPKIYQSTSAERVYEYEGAFDSRFFGQKLQQNFLAKLMENRK